MTPDQLEKLGLPEDATEEQINEKLDELTAAGTGDGETAAPDTTETSTGDKAGGKTAMAPSGIDPSRGRNRPLFRGRGGGANGRVVGG